MSVIINPATIKKNPANTPIMTSINQVLRHSSGTFRLSRKYTSRITSPVIRWV
ncbi:hypothetical protein 276BB001_13 [Bacillus phage 276BB001]|nr:hypothetical protein 276BB001_13 [Bacillus phage 276BB001]QFG05934.1 hypothetical protein 280BB001_13 [Bacillus phage 280BB001]QZA70083.1 hypothetical protein 274BB002_13 [Bacillus phage 274BB002]